MFFFLIFTTLCSICETLLSLPCLIWEHQERLFYSSLFLFRVRHNYWQTTKSNPIIQLLSSYQTNHPLISVVFLICFPKAWFLLTVCKSKTRNMEVCLWMIKILNKSIGWTLLFPIKFSLSNEIQFWVRL